jgi:hypothetical protein
MNPLSSHVSSPDYCPLRIFKRDYQKMPTSQEGAIHDHSEIMQNHGVHGSAAAADRSAEICRGDGEVLLDIGAKNIELGEASNLKLAKDGHVS